jgi:hypothetical protein
MRRRPWPVRARAGALRPEWSRGAFASVERYRARPSTPPCSPTPSPTRHLLGGAGRRLERHSYGPSAASRRPGGSSFTAAAATIGQGSAGGPCTSWLSGRLPPVAAIPTFSGCWLRPVPCGDPPRRRHKLTRVSACLVGKSRQGSAADRQPGPKLRTRCLPGALLGSARPSSWADAASSSHPVLAHPGVSRRVP